MSKLANVNTTDIPAAAALGCRAMSRVFDADDENRPFFESSILPEPLLRWNGSHSESHVPGRHLNALLNAEAAFGLPIDAHAVENHRRAAFYSYGQGIPWPLNRASKEGLPVRAIPHNIREGFHALTALVQYRGDDRARAIAEASIDWIRTHWSPERVHDQHCGWDDAAIRAAGGQLIHSPNESFVLGLGRSIGPLVKYFRATGYGPALELALILADTACAHYFKPDGGFDPALFSTHTHSTTCVMSGLAQLAETRRDMALLLRVKAFFDNGLWQIRDALGWVMESTWRRGLEGDIGEVNNTGDIVETALILGAAGFSEYYADAERIVRCHLLPSQVRDVSFIHDVAAPSDDGHRNIADRHLGAFGFPTPYGHAPPGATWLSFNMDIVGGAVGSLCEVWRQCVTRNIDGVRVNLLFDRDTADATVKSPYTAPNLSITPKTNVPLWVRLPRWAKVDLAALVAQHGRCQHEGDWLFFPTPNVGRPIDIPFALTVSDLMLKHDAHDIRVRLHGDQVAGMDHFGADLTFFENYE